MPALRFVYPSEVSTSPRVVGRLCSMVTFDPEELSHSGELSFVLKIILPAHPDLCLQYWVTVISEPCLRSQVTDAMVGQSLRESLPSFISVFVLSTGVTRFL